MIINNIPINYKITFKLLYENTLPIGKPTQFTPRNLTKFIIGTYETTEIINSIYTRHFLFWQVTPIIKFACRSASPYQALFLLASANSGLAPFFESIAIPAGLDYRVGRWLSGSLSAHLQLETMPDFIIIPDCTRSAMIVSEAHLCAIPTIGLVNSNNRIASKVSYPIFGNDNSLYTCEFFCNLCVHLILKEQAWRTKIWFPLKNNITNFRKIKLFKKCSKYLSRALKNKKWYAKWPSWFKHEVYFRMYKRNWYLIILYQQIWKMKNWLKNKFDHTFLSETLKFWKYKKLLKKRYKKVKLFGEFLWKHGGIREKMKEKQKNGKRWQVHFPGTVAEIGFKLFKYYNLRTRSDRLKQSRIYLFKNDFKITYKFIKQLNKEKLIALANVNDFFAKKYLNKLERKKVKGKSLKKRFKFKNILKKNLKNEKY
jgi:hypothetical protein